MNDLEGLGDRVDAELLLHVQNYSVLLDWMRDFQVLAQRLLDPDVTVFDAELRPLLAAAVRHEGQLTATIESFKKALADRHAARTTAGDGDDEAPVTVQ